MKQLVIDLEEEHEADEIMEEVLRLVKGGFTSGTEPTWEITNE